MSNTRLYNGSEIPSVGEYDLDPPHTFTDFIAQHLLVGQVRGRFNEVAGRIVMGEDPVESSISVVIQTASISTTNARRDKDLRSERFFDSDQFPEITFNSTSVIPELFGVWTIEGLLTIRGVPKSVRLEAKFNGVFNEDGNTRIAFEGNASINRKDFGLLAELDRETGGLSIGKDVRILLAAEAIPRTT